MTSWLIIALPITAILVAVAIWRFSVAVRKSRRLGTGEPVVKLTCAVATIWAAACVGAAIAVLNALINTQVSIDFPVAGFWPRLPDSMRIDGPTASLESGGFVEASGLVSGLGAPARICWAISQALWALVPGAIAAFIAVACAQLLRGRAFTEVVSRAAVITAVIVAAGGFAAQVLGDIAGALAADEVLRIVSAEYSEIPGIEDPLGAWWPRPGFNISLPFWPIAAGLGFAALAAIFRFGSRMQRDTEGLV